MPPITRRNVLRLGGVGLAATVIGGIVGMGLSRQLPPGSTGSVRQH